MRKCLFLILLIAAGGFIAAAQDRPRAEGRGPAVVVIAFDGFARRYLDQDSVPNLHALAREGVTGDGMIPSFPTFTFPNFYTLATGLYPDHTGIVANSFWDPAFDTEFVYTKPIAHEGRWWGGEPIWNTAAKQGKRAAAMFWVGSEGPVQGMQPAYWMMFDTRIQFESRVMQVLSWLSMPDSLRPDLIMAYFEEPDHTSHDFGPDAPQTKAAVTRVDSMLGMLVSGLKARGLYDKVNIVVVADHGMDAVGVDRAVYLDDVVDTSTVRVVSRTPLLLIEAKNGDNAALLARVRMLPHVTAWPKDSVPARLHYGTNARITAVVAVADPGWSIALRSGRAPKGGAHGYDNADPGMRALFVARGPGFVPGTVVPPFPNVDLYSLLAKLLGIVPARTDGELTPFLPVLR